jgi:hypothetical protein
LSGTIAAVPEPGTATLVIVTAVGIGIMLRKRSMCR